MMGFGSADVPAVGTRAMAEGTRFSWLAVGATAIPWVLFLAASAVGDTPALAALAFVLGTPHVLATVGLYLDSDLRPHLRANRLRYMWGPILAIGG